LVYFILIILSLGSCILFEYSKLSETVSELIASYKLQFQVMSDKMIDDSLKQKRLMEMVTKQLLLILKLIFGIFLFIAPFLSLFLLEKLDPRLNIGILVTFWGLLIPIITVLVYIFFKRSYGNIFRNR
jgi:hypothetical protein